MKRDIIYTSYFAVIDKLPSEICPIAICGYIPPFWYKMKRYKALAPKKWFFSEWKRTGDNEFYIQNFKHEVLSKLNPSTVVSELKRLADGRIPCLLCYEAPDKFCHRHLVSEWFNETIPDLVECTEYTFIQKESHDEQDEENGNKKDAAENHEIREDAKDGQ